MNGFNLIQNQEAFQFNKLIQILIILDVSQLNYALVIMKF